jgi:Gas vesicle synthesis protein GvpL/GvpF
MLLNAAYLVDRPGADRFRAEVAALAADRPPEALVLTGPWPPYSFAVLDQP